MPNWTAFASVTIVVLVLLLGLSHLTQTAFSDSVDDRATPESDDRTDAAAATDNPELTAGVESRTVPRSGSQTELERAENGAIESKPETASEHPDPSPLSEETPPDPTDPESMSTGMVLANVALSQGLFALVLIGAAIYTGIPADALGIEFSRGYLETGVLVGAGIGIGLYVANEIGAALSTRLGFDHDEQLRELLAPESKAGWAVLLGGVLPIIAVFEELLFRAAMIGVFEAGFGVSPWLLAILSSIAFGLGHGMQGSVGILVTGGLGLVLAAAFILTGSLLVVVVAHYLINAFEFIVHEGIGFEWAAVLEGDG